MERAETAVTTSRIRCWFRAGLSDVVSPCLKHSKFDLDGGTKVDGAGAASAALVQDVDER